MRAADLALDHTHQETHAPLLALLELLPYILVAWHGMASSVADVVACQSRDRLPCMSIRPDLCIPHGLTLATRCVL